MPPVLEDDLAFALNKKVKGMGAPDWASSLDCSDSCQA